MSDEPASAASVAEFFAGPQPVLRGNGLVLRPWRDDDADAVVRAFADPEIRHWHIRSLDADEAPGWIADRRGRWTERAGVDWAVAGDDEGGPVLGRMAMHRVVVEQGLGVVAYWTAPEARGARVASRALAVMCDWAFGVRGLHRLELGHSVDNPASCRVAERAGFALEGVRRASARHADGWHDMHLHARLDSDPPPGEGSAS